MHLEKGLLGLRVKRSTPKFQIKEGKCPKMSNISYFFSQIRSSTATKFLFGLPKNLWVIISLNCQTLKAVDYADNTIPKIPVIPVSCYLAKCG